MIHNVEYVQGGANLLSKNILLNKGLEVRKSCKDQIIYYRNGKRDIEAVRRHGLQIMQFQPVVNSALACVKQAILSDKLGYENAQRLPKNASKIAETLDDDNSCENLMPKKQSFIGVSSELMFTGMAESPSKGDQRKAVSRLISSFVVCPERHNLYWNLIVLLLSFLARVGPLVWRMSQSLVVDGVGFVTAKIKLVSSYNMQLTENVNAEFVRTIFTKCAKVYEDRFSSQICEKHSVNLSLFGKHRLEWISTGLLAIVLFASSGISQFVLSKSCSVDVFTKEVEKITSMQVKFCCFTSSEGEVVFTVIVKSWRENGSQYHTSKFKVSCRERVNHLIMVNAGAILLVTVIILVY